MIILRVWPQLKAKFFPISKPVIALLAPKWFDCSVTDDWSLIRFFARSTKSHARISTNLILWHASSPENCSPSDSIPHYLRSDRPNSLIVHFQISCFIVLCILYTLGQISLLRVVSACYETTLIRVK